MELNEIEQEQGFMNASQPSKLQILYQRFIVSKYMQEVWKSTRQNELVWAWYARWIMEMTSWYYGGILVSFKNTHMHKNSFFFNCIVCMHTCVCNFVHCTTDKMYTHSHTHTHTHTHRFTHNAQLCTQYYKNNEYMNLCSKHLPNQKKPSCTNFTCLQKTLDTFDCF